MMVAGDLLFEAESRGHTFAMGLGIKTRQEILTDGGIFKDEVKSK